MPDPEPNLALTDLELTRRSVVWCFFNKKQDNWMTLVRFSQRSNGWKNLFGDVIKIVSQSVVLIPYCLRFLPLMGYWKMIFWDVWILFGRPKFLARSKYLDQCFCGKGYQCEWSYWGGELSQEFLTLHVCFASQRRKKWNICLSLAW